MSAKWVVTISSLKQDDKVYEFADPKFVGKFDLSEDGTLYVGPAAPGVFHPSQGPPDPPPELA